MALLSPSPAVIHPRHLQQEFILIQAPSTDGANQPRSKSPFPFPSSCPAAAAASERERRGRAKKMFDNIYLLSYRSKTRLIPKSPFPKGKRDGRAPAAPGKRGDLGMSFPCYSCHSRGISAACRSPQCPSPGQGVVRAPFSPRGLQTLIVHTQSCRRTMECPSHGISAACRAPTPPLLSKERVRAAFSLCRPQTLTVHTRCSTGIILITQPCKKPHPQEG